MPVTVNLLVLYKTGSETVSQEFLSFQVRSETITTYALCGFANFSSLGIVIGGLCEYHFISFSCFSILFSNIWSSLVAAICPPRRGDISSLVLRAMITGTCVSLVNACIAGKSVLFDPIS